MTNNKLVIRRLPPSMSEDEFLRQVSPLPEHDYLCFLEANTNLGAHSFSRAYINFIESDDMITFRERFDNYIFLDKDGHEYPAVVEQSFWHKSPKDGPFYTRRSENRPLLSEGSASGSPTSKPSCNDDATETTKTTLGIEQDPDFIEFMEKHKASKKRNQQSPIQALESNLDELTNASNSNSANDKGGSKVMTPLMSYVNQRRIQKNNKRNRK